MEQWFAEFAVETRGRKPKKISRLFYLPTVEDVRRAVNEEGGYLLSVKPHKPSLMEQMMARTTWWQIQLLRGIQFRSTTTSPSVAFWRLIQSETNPRVQNILAPAREALGRGMGVIDALKALRIFDHSTIAILGASERSNKLAEGIPYAIQNIVLKKKNMAKIGGLIAWVVFDLWTIISSLQFGRGFLISYFRKNTPTNPADAEKFTQTVDNLALFWDCLLYFAYGCCFAIGWVILSFWINKGKTDWPTARIIRKIPLVGGYMRDLGLADSTSAAARMIRGQVPIGDALKQAAEATNFPEVSQFWLNAYADLSRGINLGAAMDKDPLTPAERTELVMVNDLGQVATILESIADLRSQKANSKSRMLLIVAFLFVCIYLFIAFGSSIFALQLMNTGMDSMMNSMMGDMGGM